MKAGGFNLRKFSSNSKTLEEIVIKKYPEEKEFISTGEQKLFGMIWNKDSDTFSYKNLSLQTSTLITRRGLLKFFAKLFDPLGLVCPLVV